MKWVLLDNFLLFGLIAGGMGRKEGRQARYVSAAHPQQCKAVHDRKSWQPHRVRHVHHKCRTDTLYEIVLVTARDMGPKFFQTFS